MARTSRRRHNESTFRRGGDLSGVNAAVEELRRKGDEVLFAAKSALKDGVDLIIADAKSRCPVRTGKLRDSIKAVDVASGAAYEITADAKNDNGVAYGQFVEFSPKINKPFLYPAIDANISEVREKVKQAIQGALRSSGNSAA